MKVGRNDKCPCGSGKKYKYCCLNNDDVEQKIKQIVSANQYDLSLGVLLCNLLRCMKQLHWIGACHATSAVLYVALSELGYSPTLCVGEVQTNVLCFDHSWIELDGKIIDLACSMTLLEDGAAINEPVILGENNHMEYGVTHYGLETETFYIINAPFPTYMDMWPHAPNGLWNIVNMILKTDLNIDELRQKYEDVQWDYRRDCNV